MKKKISFCLLAIVLVLGLSGIAFGKSDYLTIFTNKYPGTSFSCTVCHGPSGPPLNPYGSAFKSNGSNTAALTAIEPLDSDGDGASNIVEINAGTFPGDPNSKPPASDTIAPTVSGFTVPSSSNSLNVSYTITATDNVGVTGYLVTETSATPSASNPGWSSSGSGTYVFASSGAKTLYAWAKDAAGNVSTSLSATVTITLPPQPPLDEDLTIWVGKWFKITTRLTGYGYTPGGSGSSKEDLVNITGYLKIWNWDSANRILQGDRYEQDLVSGQWISEPFNLNFFAGNQLDFTCSFQVTGDFNAAFTARILGYQINRELRNANFATLGGYYMEALSNPGSSEYFAGGLKITGNLIPEATVPVPKEIITH